jgi:DNA-binding transcriptional MerR regulator
MKNGLLSISELAYLSRTTRETLLFYDRIGLIKPATRAANNYRYYSHDQIAILRMIHTFQSLGMRLEDIKEIVEHRSPQTFLAMYEELLEQIDYEIAQLHRARSLLTTLNKIVIEGISADETKILYHYQEAESIMLGPQIDYSDGKTDFDALVDFYHFCKENDPDINLNWAAWGFFSGERIRNRDWRYPDRFYFSRPNSPDVKPAGWYVTGYSRGDYGHTDELYERLLAYIDENGLEIIGDVYEAYVLNEITVVEPKDYLIRSSIQVAER